MDSTPSSKWESSTALKMIIFAFMANDLSVVFLPGESSHNSPTFLYMILQLVSVVFVGIPLVYSTLAVVQYSECNAVTMWDFFPLFRGVGYGTYFIVLLKSIHTLVLASWYLEYAFFSALNPPPWYSCDEFGDKCMVKQINMSTFQHCLEMAFQFNDDCGIDTSSSMFFDREIGNNTLFMNWPNCMYPWRILIVNSSIFLLLFVMTLKNDKYITFVVKIMFTYVIFVVFSLFCIALSTCGGWFSSRMTPGFSWLHADVYLCLMSFSRGFLGLGTGTGVLVYLYKGSSFRSPVNMTAITVSLLSVMVSLMYIISEFSGAKNMSFYHGEENVMEVPNNAYFIPFGSASEILTYFTYSQVWTFLWFSSIFLCLFVNEWICYLYLREAMNEAFPFLKNWQKIVSFLMLMVMYLLAMPFFCSDLTVALTDATHATQAISSLFISIAFYWFYGYSNHKVDIIFMIGVKASYFWTLAWTLNPIFLTLILYSLLSNLLIFDEDMHSDEQMKYYDEFFPIACDALLFYIIIGIYGIIVMLATLMEIIHYCRTGKLRDIISPTENWGPKDLVLAKSRSMFVPEIMTREFLYRQVKIHGYCQTQKKMNTQLIKAASKESFSDHLEWSALTSN